MGASDCYPRKAPKVNAVLDTLSHHLRREVIHYFENVASELTATVDELVTHVDARVPREDRETLAAALAHSHLPKLAERGWLDFDRRTGHVRYHGHDEAAGLLRDVEAVVAG